MLSESTVYIVDDDKAVLRSITDMLMGEGLTVQPYELPNDFLADVNSLAPGCLVVDLKMPGMSGIELLERLREHSLARPAVVISGYAEVSTAVLAMQLGAVNVLEKPFRPDELLSSVRTALELDWRQRTNSTRRAAAAAKLANLSQEEVQVLRGILRRQTIQEIAQEIGFSKRTVDLRIAGLMRTLGVKTRAQLIDLAHDAQWL